MKSSIMSIILLLTTGMGPATQPARNECNPQLRLLQMRLAVLRAPYGSSYPETSEMISLKNRIAALEAAATQTISASATAPATQPAASELLHMKMMLAGANAEFGQKNAAVALMRTTITRLEASGAKIDLNEANALFKKLLDQRQHLLKTYGLRHPTVVALTRQINYLSTLLANDPASD